MTSFKRITHLHTLFGATALLLFSLPLVWMGCADRSADSPVGTGVPQESLERMGEAFAQGDPVLLRAVTQATARFHSITQAQNAGYEGGECVSVPGLGGMGEHWVNGALVDPIFDPLQPEVLLYEPQPNGKKKLVAVEYIVIDIGQPRPSFGDKLFDIGGTPVPVAHWSLHVWLWKTNPNGLFTPFNPNVSCPE